MTEMTNDLIDTGGIAKMLGITRAWATDNITKQPWFPRPRVNLSQRLRLWSRDDVIRCVKKETAKA